MHSCRASEINCVIGQIFEVGVVNAEKREAECFICHVSAYKDTDTAACITLPCHGRIFLLSSNHQVHCT